MGDRANVIIKSGSEQVCLYTHWSGSELPEIVREALLRGRQRWDDFQYLTRIIFCQMVPAGERLELTGFGITNQVHDNERPVITVNCDEQTVAIGNGAPVPLDKYVASAPATYESAA